MDEQVETRAEAPEPGATQSRAKPRAAAAAAPYKRQAVVAGTTVEAVEAGGKPPPVVICIAGDGPAEAGEMAGYRLVVNKRHGSRRPGEAKAADRAPVGRLS
eukprot:6790135-Prymnesium_polylepis.1